MLLILFENVSQKSSVIVLIVMVLGYFTIDVHSQNHNEVPTLSPEISCQSDGNPVWSPDNGRIAFVSERSGNSDIWIMDVDGVNAYNLTISSESPDINPLWSPDGASIAFLSGRNGFLNVWIMDADGSNPINLTNNITGNDGSPAWSPDGNYIAVPSESNGIVDIWLINIHDRSRINITQNSGESYKWPAWSSDSRRLVFTTFSNQEVFIVDIDTLNLITLENSEFNIRAVWGHNSQYILVSKAQKIGGNIDIWRIAADGSNRINLTEDNLGIDLAPAQSPDGRTIVFQSEREDQSDIWRMDFDGSNLINLTSEIDGVAMLPAWSQDGNHIVFQILQGERSNIWVVNADGTNPTNLTAVHCRNR